MLESTFFFFINILKIVVSPIGTLSSLIRLQRLLYFCAKISLYYSAIFTGRSTKLKG